MGPLLYYRLVAPEQVLPQLRAAARRALELDDRLGEAHVAMGIIHFFYEWDWPAAHREFRRATELNPGDPHAFHMLANYRRATRRFGDAIAARRQAITLDPLNPRLAISLGRDYMAAGQYDRALEAYRRGHDIDSLILPAIGRGPNLPAGPGEVYERQGRHAAAVAEYLQVATRRGAPASELSALREGFAGGGMRTFWRRWLVFEERAASGTPRALLAARIWAQVGDTTRALEGLERAFRERDPGLVYLAVDPDWAGMRAHPGVAALLDRMKLPR